MKIRDLNGIHIEVEDLEGAIEQADFFRGLSHEVPQRFDLNRQRYWEDLHRKLLTIKQKQDEQSNRQDRI